MKISLVHALLPIAIALAACSTDISDGGAGDDPGGSVKTTPLSGNINGHAFEGRVALVRKDPDKADQRDVTIYNQQVTCATDPGFTDYMVFLDVTSWAPGLTYALDQTHMVNLFVKDGNQNLFATKGRVEVDSSGQSLRLRADTGMFGSIEGQVPILLCE